MKIEYGATNDIEEECANFAEAYACLR